MAKRKKVKFRPEDKTGSAQRLGEAVEGLYYTSETDAAILPFSGEKANSVTQETLLAQIKKNITEPVEERYFEEFFSRLTGIQDWYGDDEKQTARRFEDLKKLLETELTELKVFRVGSVEIDIYVVGLDGEGKLTGIKTQAVET